MFIDNQHSDCPSQDKEFLCQLYWQKSDDSQHTIHSDPTSVVVEMTGNITVVVAAAETKLFSDPTVGGFDAISSS